MTIFHVGKPNTNNSESFASAVSKMFRNGWITNNGPLVQELESKLESFFGVENCIVMCNGTIAMELAIRANNISGEAIVPSMTFIAGPHSLQWQGITPVFADINPTTLNLSLESIAQRITDKTTAIIPVHLYGRPSELECYEALADRHSLKLIFDAAHAFGCSYKGSMIGGFGNCEVFSFHATKVFNCFEGGAVTTNDDELAKKLRLMRNFGFEGEDRVSYIGTNGKMTEICAAMGLANLQNIDQDIQDNHSYYEVYKNQICEIEGLSIVLYDEIELNNYHYVIIAVDESTYGKTRNQLKSKLEANGVMARRYFYPGCHRMEPYKTLFPNASKYLPNTEKFSEQVLALPTGSQMQMKDVERICQILKEFSDE